MARSFSISLLFLSAIWAQEIPYRPVIGLVPSPDAQVTQDLADGIRLALRDTPYLLVVGDTTGAWGSAATTAVHLALDCDAIALITPPERSTAHLLAQIGSRTQIPIVTTSTAPTVTATGSPWVQAPMAPAPTGFPAHFEKHHGRPATPAARLAYQAALTVLRGPERLVAN